MVNKELRLKDVYAKLSQQTKEFIDLHYNEDVDCPVSSITMDIAYIQFDTGWNYPTSTINEIFRELQKYEFVYKQEDGTLVNLKEE